MGKTLSNSYMTSFCMELSMLLNAGISPLDTILMLIDDERDKDGKAVLNSLLPPLEEGLPLSTALKESKYFPNYMVFMLEAGETTGRQTEALRALAAHYERQERISVAVKNAVLYPSVLLVLMVAVVLILIIRVLPIFNDVFGRMGSQMSPLAQSLLGFGGALSNASAVIAVVFGAVFVVGFVSWLVPPVRLFLTRAFKNAFGGKGLMGELAASRFASVMALGIASGLETDKAVEMASVLSGGAKAIDKKHKKCIEMLLSGEPLADAMFDAGIFNTRNTRMLALGAKSGMTDLAMAEIAERSGREVQDGIDRLIGKIEPTLVIITSVIIGVILFSVMLPLMGIMTSIG